MPAKDIYHFALKKALEKDDWEITKDPFAISTPGVDFYIDLGAERNFIEAEWTYPNCLDSFSCIYDLQIKQKTHS
ncbi:element excision factor XisH family protein [Phaeodactylibacter xiamenensis]|uniref:element excision factor XisH family protein n=1 Tax=Phaeodactylibacter xiamenensis TaxID=1524460 RepID=UPI003CCB964A